MFEFQTAALRLAARYYRRFPGVHHTRWDATSIKDRWYRRHTCHFVRVRLDGVFHQTLSPVNK